jgi:ribosomal protein S18 acetylase RimI-like enzyme
MVNPVHRGLGIGSILGKAFLRIVPVIGYKASMFNLVFVSNVASIKLWRRLGFQEIGRIPNAGRLRGQGKDKSEGGSGENEGYVDAIQFYWDFETMAVNEA